MKDIKPEELYVCLPYSEYLIKTADLEKVVHSMIPANVSYDPGTDKYVVQDVRDFSNMSLRMITGEEILAAQARKRLEG